MVLRMAALLLAVSCANSSGPSLNLPGAPQVEISTEPSQVRAVAEGTALLTLLLHADGTAALTGLVKKPIPFRGRQLVAFDAARHEPAAASLTAPGSGPPSLLVRGALPVVRVPQVVVGLSSLADGPLQFAHVLVISSPSLKTPLVVPLELGAPGEGGGDVTDRWADETLVIRAPSFGEGTRYSLVRVGADSALLAERLEQK